MSEAPAYERRKYGSNDLRLVLCQVRFPILLRFDEPAFQAKVQDALRADYPRMHQEQQVAVTVGPGGLVSTPAGVQWRYEDLQAEWSVVLQGNSAGLETKKYRVFEDFAARLAPLLRVLTELGVTVCERLGLRYINEFRHEAAQLPQDWKSLLHEDLLGIAGGDLWSGQIVHAIQEIRTKRSDGSFVVRHGYVNPDDGRGSYYLLDLDYFDEEPRSFDEGGILSRLDDYHEEISKAFEMSLKPAMREHLGEEATIDA